MPDFHEILQAIPVIISLIIIEGLLSVDNALAIAAMASHLPGKQKFLALRWGIIGAYAFRGLALAFVAFIVHNPWLKIVGAAYLIHLMASFFAEKAEQEKAEESAEEEGDGAGASVAKAVGRGLLATIVAIEVMDLSLSVDNVVAAVALDKRLWVVCTGVFIGILALRFVAGFCIKLIERFPILEATAFVLIGFVGAILVVEVTSELLSPNNPIVIHSYQKFIGILLILGVAIGYSESKRMKATLRPIFRGARGPLLAYAAVSNGILAVIFYPFKALAGLFKSKEPAKDGAAPEAPQP